ncbi:unnamed protein product, partial [Tetraodon nigroviridis]
VRLYATKKAKARAKGQSARVSINAALVEDIVDLDQVKTDMAAVLSALQDDFTRSLSLRTSPDAYLRFHGNVTALRGDSGDGKSGRKAERRRKELERKHCSGSVHVRADQRRELSSGAVGGEGVSVALPLPRTQGDAGAPGEPGQGGQAAGQQGQGGAAAGALRRRGPGQEDQGGTLGGHRPAGGGTDSAAVRQHGRRRGQAAGGQDQGAAGLTEETPPLTPDL